MGPDEIPLDPGEFVVFSTVVLRPSFAILAASDDTELLDRVDPAISPCSWVWLHKTQRDPRVVRQHGGLRRHIRR